MKAWKRIEPTETHKIGWRTIVTKYFELPDGRVERFDSMGVEGQEFAAVIALTSDKKVVIARQFRFGPEKVMDELPGGGVELGEDPAKAVVRELLEETGYKAGKIEPLGAMHQDAYMNGTWHYFLATDCKLVQAQELDSHEFIDVVLLGIDEFMKKAKAGEVSDAAAVLLAYEKLLELRG